VDSCNQCSANKWKWNFATRILATAEEMQEESQWGVPGRIWLDTLFNYNEQPGKDKRTGRSRTVFPFVHEFPEKTSRHSLSRGPV